MQAVPCRFAVGNQSGDFEPLPQLGSHDFLSLRGARLLALVPEGTGRAEAGEEVEAVPLGADNMA